MSKSHDLFLKNQRTAFFAAFIAAFSASLFFLRISSSRASRSLIRSSLQYDNERHLKNISVSFPDTGNKKKKIVPQISEKVFSLPHLFCSCRSRLNASPSLMSPSPKAERRPSIW